MRLFYVELKGDGLKGYKRTENKIIFREEGTNFKIRMDRLKSTHCILTKQYPENTDVFEEEKILRKLVNGGRKADWCLLDDGSYLVVKFTNKDNNKVNNGFKEYGFEEMAL